MFDVVLPSVLFLCASSSLLLFLKYEEGIESAFEGEFCCKHAVLAVVMVGSLVTIMAMIPEEAIMFAFLFYFAAFLFKLAHVYTKRLRLSIIVPAVFIGLYLFSWNVLLMDLFATTIIVFSTALLSGALTRETKKEAKSIVSRRNILSGLLLFIVLIVLADIVLVSGTNLMETAARKIVKLQLPLLVIMPTFPSTGGHTVLGLGDILLSGLLGILAAKRTGRRPAVTCILSISATVLLGETIMLNFDVAQLPATVLVVPGWLIALGMRQLLGHGHFFLHFFL